LNLGPEWKQIASHFGLPSERDAIFEFLKIKDLFSKVSQYLGEPIVKNRS